MIQRSTPIPSLIAIVLLFPGLAAAQRAIDFKSEIEPILKTHCISCHGPEKQKNNLRLDSRADALKGGDEGPAVIPGKSAESGLIDHVVGIGDAAPMPPTGERLTDEQVIALRAWIDQGATWPDATGPADAAAAKKNHWAFQPLVHPEPPQTRDSVWPRNPIDRFILSRLEEKGLNPSPEADRRTLIRRLTYDLHGLPPSPAEVEAFERDPAPDAYAKLVERLLASPRYGEHWGRHWLDVAHYGETHGFDKDKRRENAWPYRDYVIDAFNNDKPYSHFVREQIAGDILAPGDPQGIVATGFLAAGPWDFVGHAELREGTMEKARVRALDRDDMLANTVGSFMSLTIHCARCHDHKFDPIPQREYYAMQSVFAGIDRGDRSLEEKGAAEARKRLQARIEALKFRQENWAKKLEKARSLKVDAARVALQEVEERLRNTTGGDSPSNGYHSAISSTPDEEKWVQIDLGSRQRVDSVTLVPARPTDFPDTPGFGFPERFKVEIADDADFKRPGMIADWTGEDFPNPGAGEVRFETESKVGIRGRYIRVTATKLWKRTGDYVFALAELEVSCETETRSAAVTAKDSIEGGRWGTKYLIDGYDSRKPLTRVLGNASVDPERDKARAATLRSMVAAAEREWAGKANGAEIEQIASDLAESEKALSALPKPPMVYAPIPHEPREIQILKRGDVSSPGETVGPGALSLIAGLEANLEIADPATEGVRRAALAAWITDHRNALTWRSIVNRVWEYHFGRGIVSTPSDFGRQGTPPSHPELLDWLANEFLARGESIKELHRLIVTSATYRQAVTPNADAEKLDADNRLLWRMNRRRLTAEEIRDSILAASGALDSQMGGPSFDLFRFKDDHSPIYDYASPERPESFRRSVYRTIVRSVPDPFMYSLDCADPDISTPVRNETYTALQALSMLNDPFVLRQSAIMAARLDNPNATKAEVINAAYELTTNRAATDGEIADLTAYASRQGLAQMCRLLFNANEFMFID